MIRGIALFIFCLTACNAAVAQSLFQSLEKESSGYKKNARALIIGVSDYAYIRDLNFAHKDAELLAEFLIDSPFWELDDERLFLLTNENARQGDILMGLQWLSETSKSGEDVLFFFSGHGDVESQGDGTRGYLLAHDSPKNNYAVGGTVPVDLLDSVFTELIKREVKLTLIVDACKSGQLAGGMNGTGQTNEVLSKKWNNQIRMLSAQPDQLSVEDSTYGGGHGVFTYYLVKGLTGYAEIQPDSLISLFELNTFLTANMGKQTNFMQNPVIEGPNMIQTNLAFIDEQQMLQFRDDNISNEVFFSMVAMKGVDDEVDESCQKAYELCKSEVRSLNRDNFKQILDLYTKAIECGSADHLRYQIMRSIINELNLILNQSISGEELHGEEGFYYGLELIDELFKINEGKKLIGATHFENLRNYLKSLFYSYSEETIWDEQLYRIPAAKFSDEAPVYIPDQLIRYQSLLDEHVFNDTVADFEFQASYFEAAALFEYLLNHISSEEPELELVYLEDPILIRKANRKNAKSRKKSGFLELDKVWERQMMEQIKHGLLAEPDAAYLYHALAFLQKDKKVAIGYLDSAIAFSPKWLTPRYMKGVYYIDKGEHKKAINAFESVFDLDEQYKDFECVDCFYLGLISSYVTVNAEPGKIERAKNQWRNDRGRSQSDFQLARSLLTYNEGDRKNMSYWWKQMHLNSSGSFPDQIMLMQADLETKKGKFKKKKVELAIYELLRLMEEYGDDFLVDLKTGFKQLDSWTSNEVLLHYFKELPEEDIVPEWEVNKDTLFSYLEFVANDAIGKGLLLDFNESLNLFYFSALNRYQSASDYLFFAKTLRQLGHDQGMQASWLEEKEFFSDPEEIFEYALASSEYEYFRFAIDEFGSELAQELEHIFSGRSIEEIRQYQELKKRCSGYSDLRALDDVLKELSVFVGIQ